MTTEPTKPEVWKIHLSFEVEPNKWDAQEVMEALSTMCGQFFVFNNANRCISVEIDMVKGNDW